MSAVYCICLHKLKGNNEKKLYSKCPEDVQVLYKDLFNPLTLFSRKKDHLFLFHCFHVCPTVNVDVLAGFTNLYFIFLK